MQVVVISVEHFLRCGLHIPLVPIVILHLHYYLVEHGIQRVQVRPIKIFWNRAYSRAHGGKQLPDKANSDWLQKVLLGPFSSQYSFWSQEVLT